ncbi:MAG: lipopolysaccharide assembly protein LapA domain-containing protein [Smithellaceae bacterium]|nr:lipopolysaccharide assembly protein LapA domain-containing protein [Smithellaceae bacterium]
MTTVALILIIIALVTIFSVQNAAPVAISFLFWKFEASLAIIIFLMVISGIIIGIVSTLLLRLKSRDEEETKYEP